MHRETRVSNYVLAALSALALALLSLPLSAPVRALKAGVVYLLNPVAYCGDKGAQRLADAPFGRVTYTEAIKLLEASGKTFEFAPYWGMDMQSEHERYLTEETFKRPVIVTDYPKEIKAFYMRMNPDGKTVAAMDVLVPKIGEIIGGSQREERHDLLKQKIIDHGLPLEDYWWYLQLRQYGSVPHAGFGAGFERLVLFATGMENIRDVIPFPRFPSHADF